jgi:NADH-quinone oxidoreductase subunit N
MSTTELQLLLPVIVLAGTILVVLLQIAILRRHALTVSLTLVGLVLAGLAILPAWQIAPGDATILLRVDQLGLMYIAILLFAALIITIVSYPYLKEHAQQPEEYYLLLLLATLGGAFLSISNHFAALFLGLETLSISLYGLLGYLREREHSIEAAIKYLILAAVSSAFLLFGIAMFYMEQGTLSFNQLDFSQVSSNGVQAAILFTGFGMFFVGIGFKLAVVPFHMWIPDVYQGAPAPAAGFVATVSKAAVFAVLLRLAVMGGFSKIPSLILVFAVLAILSMFVGNFLALLQNNVKRILAYSSIAHLGYLLVPLLASMMVSIVSATFYVAAYVVTMLGAFSVITVLSSTGNEVELMDDFQGLYWRRPWLAALFTLVLFSLIGIPLTAGFMGKFFILTAGIGATQYIVAAALVISSVIGLYYYLRIVVAMFLRLESAPAETPAVPGQRMPWQFMGGLALGVLMILILWLGLYPTSFVNMIQAAAGSL